MARRAGAPHPLREVVMPRNPTPQRNYHIRTDSVKKLAGPLRLTRDERTAGANIRYPKKKVAVKKSAITIWQKH